MNEIWKNITVEGFENYQVSNCGNVRSSLIRTKWGGWTTRKNPILLHQERTKEGYYRVALYNNKCGKKFAVHRLVAMAFIPNPENLPEINHIDENPSNNMVNNLEWCSRKYNANFGTLPKRESEWGMNNPKKSKPVIQLSVEGKLINEFPSINEAVRQTGISERGIGRCCMGKAQTSGGYKWIYKFNK